MQTMSRQQKTVYRKKNPTLPQIKKHLQECLREAQPTEIMQVTQAMALLQEPDLHGILEKYIK